PGGRRRHHRGHGERRPGPVDRARGRSAGGGGRAAQRRPRRPGFRSRDLRRPGAHERRSARERPHVRRGAVAVDWLLEPFEYDFMQRALLAGVLAAIATSAIGTWVVIRGLAFLSDALA